MKTMKTILTLFVAVLMMTSCKTENNLYVEYPMKEVSLNTQRLFASVESPILASRAKGANGKVMAGRSVNSLGLNTTDNFTFQEYIHSIPDKFTAYFYAADGSDQGALIHKFENLSEGSHNITVQARPFVIVVSDYESNYGRDINNNLTKLPENSNAIHLLGQVSVDFRQVNDATVEVKNSYAAVLIYKNDVIKSTPRVNGFQFVSTDDYYLGYLRDQNNGNIFNRNIQVDVLKRDGSIQNYNINGTYTANKNFYYLFKTTATTEGGFTIEVQEDILKENREEVIITN